MTPRTRQILRSYFALDSAKAAGARFGITERSVRRIRDEALRRTGCRNQWELARLVLRRERKVEMMSEPLPW